MESSEVWAFDRKKMEISNARKLGSSLRVLSVQELAKEKYATVPLQYIRPDKEPEVLIYTNLLEIPVIDMKVLLDGDLMDAELNNWADVFYISTLPTDLRKPHLLPQLPQSFREAKAE